MRIGGCDGQRADRRSAFLVEHGRPGERAIVGFPYPATNSAKPIRGGIAHDARNGERPPAAERPDGAVMHVLEDWIVGLGGFVRDRLRGFGWPLRGRSLGY